MPTQNVGVLLRILNDVQATMQLGIAQLHPILLGLVALLGTLGLVWVSYTIIVHGHALTNAFGLMLRIGFVLMLLDRWPWLLGGLRDLAMQLGLMATGDTVSLAQMLDPGQIVKMGLDSGLVLWQAFQNNMGWTTPITGLAFLLAWLGYVGSFTTIAWKMFWFQFELLLASLAGLCLMPTLCFKATSFVAQNIFSYAANMAVRFLISTILIGALWNHLRTLTSLARPQTAATLAAVDFTIQEAFYATALAIILGACMLSVNRLASMLTSGIPGMAGATSFGSMLRMVGGGAAATVTMGAGLTTAALGTARVGAGAIQGGLGAARALPSAVTAGSLGAAAREVYAGAQSRMSGGMQARLGQLMGPAYRLGDRAGDAAARHIMGASRNGYGDHMHQGVRR